MNQRRVVFRQAIACVIAVCVAFTVSGSRTALPVMITTGAGAILVALLVLGYSARRRHVDPRETIMRRRAGLNVLLGVAAPVAGAAIVYVAGPSWHGVLFDSVAASAAMTAIVAMTTVTIPSSMFDWFLILPTIFGVFGPAAWEGGDARGGTNWRLLAQVWITHRAAAELVFFSGLALALTIGFTAIGELVETDDILQTSIESLGGTGTVLLILTFISPRLRSSARYLLSGSPGPGAWVNGTDEFGNRIHGLVLEISIFPGVVLRELGGQVLVPLDAAGQGLVADQPPDAIAEELRREWILTQLVRG